MFIVLRFEVAVIWENWAWSVAKGQFGEGAVEVLRRQASACGDPASDVLEPLPPWAGGGRPQAPAAALARHRAPPFRSTSWATRSSVRVESGTGKRNASASRSHWIRDESVSPDACFVGALTFDVVSY